MAACHNRPGARLLNGLLALALGVLISGCAARPGPELLQPTVAAPNAQLVDILVATSRERAAPGVNVFTNGRSPSINLPRLRWGSRPGHQPGRVQFAALALITAAASNDDRAGGADARAFNQRIMPAVRTARRRASSCMATTTTSRRHCFGWPRSRRMPTCARRRSCSPGPPRPACWATWPTAMPCLFSRDYLAALLISLATNRMSDGFGVVAHSMGGWLLGRNHCGSCGSPDGMTCSTGWMSCWPRPTWTSTFSSSRSPSSDRCQRPMTLLVSNDDRALAVSSRLSGASERVGRLDVNDPRVQAAALRARIQIVDVSTLRRRTGWAMTATWPSPRSIRACNSAQAAGEGLHRAGSFVLDAAGAIWLHRSR